MAVAQQDTRQESGNTKGTSTTGDGIDAQASPACVPTQTGSGGGGASSTTETNATNSRAGVTVGENMNQQRHRC